MIQVKVESIRVNLINQSRLVVLQEIDGPRFLVIWIGPFEAEAITIGLKGTEMDRPLTHDLLRGLIEQLDAQIERIVISELHDDTFFARIVIARGAGDEGDAEDETGDEVEIDARPSDAIALAVRAEVPIFVMESVMDAAGQTPSEEETESEGVAVVPSSSEGGRKEDDGGLDIFREFFEGLERGDNGDRGEPETDD